MANGVDHTTVAELAQRLRAIVGQTCEAVVIHQFGRLVFVNPAAVGMVGAGTADELLGRRIVEFVPPADVPALLTRVSTTLDQGGAISTRTEMTVRRLDGSTVEVESVAVATRWEGWPAVLGLMHDVTSEHAAKIAARTAEERFSAVVSGLGEGVVVADATGRIEFANPAATRILSDRVAVGTNTANPAYQDRFPLVSVDGEVLAPTQRPLARTLRTGQPGRYVVGINGGSGRVWLSVACTLLASPTESAASVVMVVMVFTDITDHRRTTADLAYRATHDYLTGLPNRAHTMGALDHYLSARHRRDPLVVMFIDLDNLKTINDTHGHSVGDIVLRTCAERLRVALPTSATLGRFGGDEFVALHLDGVDALTDITARLHTTLHAPVTTPTAQIRPRASIGVVIVPPDDTRTTDNILRDADLTMYTAKAHGGNRTHYFTRHS